MIHSHMVISCTQQLVEATTCKGRGRPAGLHSCSTDEMSKFVGSVALRIAVANAQQLIHSWRYLFQLILRLSHCTFGAQPKATAIQHQHCLARWPLTTQLVIARCATYSCIIDVGKLDLQGFASELLHSACTSSCHVRRK